MCKTIPIQVYPDDICWNRKYKICNWHLLQSLWNLSIQILFDFFHRWKFSLLKFIAAYVPPSAAAGLFDQKVVRKTFAYFQLLPYFNNYKHFIYEQINLEYFWEKSMWNISKANLLIVSFHMFLSFMLFLKFVDTFTVGFFYHLGNFQNIWQMFF